MIQSSTAFVGMDVHKESIDVAIADDKAPRHYGRIGGDAHSVDRVIGKLRSVHRKLMVVYEAGPCGFWLYRRLKREGIACMVVSPSMTPRNAADRVKTDRRDALKLARLARAGELEPIYVPDEGDEAMRDLVRAARGRYLQRGRSARGVPIRQSQEAQQAGDLDRGCRAGGR